MAGLNLVCMKSVLNEIQCLFIVKIMLWAEFVAKGISSSNEDLLRKVNLFYMKYLGNISYLKG